MPPSRTRTRCDHGLLERAFRGCRSPAEVILWAVPCYLQFPVSYRNLERMLADRGVAVEGGAMSGDLEPLRERARAACDSGRLYEGDRELMSVLLSRLAAAERGEVPPVEQEGPG
jgi:hypothetical protein